MRRSQHPRKSRRERLYWQERPLPVSVPDIVVGLVQRMDVPVLAAPVEADDADDPLLPAAAPLEAPPLEVPPVVPVDDPVLPYVEP